MAFARFDHCFHDAFRRSPQPRSLQPWMPLNPRGLGMLARTTIFHTVNFFLSAAVDLCALAAIIRSLHGDIQRLIGAIRREYLDRIWFWNQNGRQCKLEAYQTFYHQHRCHTDWAA